MAAAPFHASLRDVNEQRRQLFGHPDRLIAFVCECSDGACTDAVVLTAEQYDARRPGAVVAEGHEGS
jgi:hypothetical protein